MKINEVEALVGITKKNIRFYEDKRLLAPRRNSENGYRDYGEGDVAALQRIKLLRKLGLPIEEIRRMQEGTQTVGDGMRRHLVTLERERQNLEQSVRLCTLLQDCREPLSELDAPRILEEMTALEQSGTTFQNKQKLDVPNPYIAPLAISLLIILFLAGTVWLILWSFSLKPEAAPPLGLMIFLFALPLLVAAGTLLALRQRIQEIRKGEMNDARKY